MLLRASLITFFPAVPPCGGGRAFIEERIFSGVRLFLTSYSLTSPSLIASAKGVYAGAGVVQGFH